jgi:hypothetical protein
MPAVSLFRSSEGAPSFTVAKLIRFSRCYTAGVVKGVWTNASNPGLNDLAQLE